MPLLEAVMGVNERQPDELLALLHRHFDSLRDVRVAVLGLAFRPGTDDVRDSPALRVVSALLSAGAQVTAYDPAVRPRAAADPRFKVCATLAEAIAGAAAVVLVTRWEQFHAVPALLAGVQPPPVLVDGRRMLDKHAVARYEGIGL